jgi:hypothetical protein
MNLDSMGSGSVVARCPSSGRSGRRRAFAGWWTSSR